MYNGSKGPSGFSSVWGGTCTTHPYTVNKVTSRGPAWGRSLFEDNAEYCYGVAFERNVREYVHYITGKQTMTDQFLKVTTRRTRRSRITIAPRIKLV